MLIEKASCTALVGKRIISLPNSNKKECFKQQKALLQNDVVSRSEEGNLQTSERVQRLLGHYRVRMEKTLWFDAEEVRREPRRAIRRKALRLGSLPFLQKI